MHPAEMRKKGIVGKSKDLALQEGMQEITTIIKRYNNIDDWVQKCDNGCFKN